MTTRNKPTQVLHFTHIGHLPTVIQRGLLSDKYVRDLLTTEVGNRDIKNQRRQQTAKLAPGGTVDEYVPFYFAPRSPMMYSIFKGNVPSYQGGVAKIVYLCSTLESLHGLGHRILLTDRNAALNYADYREFDPADHISDGFIDWDLMLERYWVNTPENPQRVERRMAETLVHHRVEWEAIMEVVVRDEEVGQEVRGLLAGVGSKIPVNIKPDWYF